MKKRAAGTLSPVRESEAERATTPVGCPLSSSSLGSGHVSAELAQAQAAGVETSAMMRTPTKSASAGGGGSSSGAESAAGAQTPLEKAMDCHVPLCNGCH